MRIPRSRPPPSSAVTAASRPGPAGGHGAAVEAGHAVGDPADGEGGQEPLPGPGGPPGRALRVVEDGHDRRGQGVGPVGRDQQGGAVVDDLADGREVAGHDGRLQGHRLQQDAAEPLPAGRDHEHVGGAEQLGHVVALAEEVDRAGEDGTQGRPQPRRLVALAAGHDQPRVPVGVDDRRERGQQHVKALLVLVPGRGQYQRCVRLQPQRRSGGPPAGGRAGAEDGRVAAAGDDLDPLPGHPQPGRHQLGHVAGDGVEADHPAGAGRVEQPGRAQLPARQSRGAGLGGAVGVVDQARHHRDAAGDDPPDQVGLEQGGVDQVGPGGLDQAPGPDGGPGHAAVAVERRHGRPGCLQVELQARSLVEVADGEAQVALGVAGRQRGQRALGPARGQAVDEVENAHR
jgi:hypothetical protein